MPSRDELFEVPPARFTQARDALVKELRAAGKDAEAKSVASLRKPTAALWVTNQLARIAPAEVEGLIDAAQRMRRAHQTGSGDELREAMRAQHDAALGMSRAAQAAASRIGARASLDLLRRVQETAQAAAISAPEALRSGTLEQELSAPGFEALSGTRVAPAKARPRTATKTPRSDTSAAANRKHAREEQQRFHRELRDAERTARELDQRAARAEEHARRAQEAADEARSDAVDARRRAREAAEAALALRAKL